MNLKIWAHFYKIIFFLNPDYVAARLLCLLHSNNQLNHQGKKIHNYNNKNNNNN